MNFEDARHLVSRTAFGTPPSEIAALQKLSRTDAVDRVLRTSGKATTQLPEWASEAPISRRELRKMMGDPKELQKFIRMHAIDLKGWWLAEMRDTNQPLTERMTLFWSGHFTSSFRKVKNPWSMLRQNEMLRRNALGSFKTMLAEIVRDPAMLVYLDNHQNSSKKPNENLARELFELFTLGEGHYSEMDIKEAARALSGYGVDRRTSTFRFRRMHHDRGEKTIFGKTGNYDGDDLVDLVLEHPACAPYVSEKVWDHFVTTPISAETKTRLAKRFSRKWDIGGLVRDVLISDEFWAVPNRGTKLRSPVELVIGTVRTMGLDLDDPKPLIMATRQLGQDVFSPPNVKGWPGGERWIDANSLLKRHITLRRAVTADSALTRNPEKWSAPVLKGTKPLERITRILLPVPPVVATPASLSRDTLEALIIDPAYQLA